MRARAQYESDRDLVRKARPKTEDEIVKLIGRKPDSVVDVSTASPPYAMLMWIYQSKADSRDVLHVTVQGGKITLMNL